MGLKIAYGCVNGFTPPLEPDLVIPDGVTTICGSVFKGNRAIRSVRIPDSVTSIGDNAFRGCENLVTVEAGQGLENIGKSAFCGCVSLKSFTMGESMCRISTKAFSGCRSLTDVTLPHFLTGVDDRAFEGTPWLDSDDSPLVIKDGVLFLSRDRSIEQAVIPENVNIIAGGAFAHHERLKSVDIPENVRYIGKMAFLNCGSLAGVDIPSGVSAISESAFAGCGTLNLLHLHEGLQQIEESAFHKCTALPSADIPASVAKIEKDAFSGCTGLREIVLHSGLRYIKQNAFSGCTSLTAADIPDSVTAIGAGAFSGCGSLESVRLPAGLKAIDSGTFENCARLKEINIPDSVTKIDDRAFFRCGSLKRAVSRGELSCIGDNAFSGCTSLTEAVFSACLCTIGSHAFTDVPAVRTLFGDIRIISDSIVFTDRADRFKCSDAESRSVTIPEGVTTICSHAFHFCNWLTSLTLPASLKYIGGFAFENCRALTEIVFSGSGDIKMERGVFESDKALRSVKLRSGMTELPEYCFWDSGLQFIEIPASVERIGQCALMSCGYVKLSRIPKNISVNALAGSVIELADGTLTAPLPETLKTSMVKCSEKELCRLYLLTRDEQAVYPEFCAEQSRLMLDILAEKGFLSQYRGEAFAEYLARFADKVPARVIADGFGLLKRSGLSRAAEMISSNFDMDVIREKSALPETPVTHRPEELRVWGDRMISQRIPLCSGVRYADWSGSCSGQAVRRIIQYVYRNDMETANSLADALDRAQLLSELKKRQEYRAMFALADGEQLISLIDTILGDSPESVRGDSERLHSSMCGLMSNRTREAKLYFINRDMFREYVNNNHLDNDKTVLDMLDFGFGGKLKKTWLPAIDLTAEVLPDLSVRLTDSAGNTLEMLPDAVSPARTMAKKEISDLRRNLKPVSVVFREWLCEKFLTGDRFPADSWISRSPGAEPLPLLFSKGAIWEQSGRLFVSDGTALRDIRWDIFTPDAESGIRLAHPMEMTPEDIRDWKARLSAEGISQPFAQLDEPVNDFSRITPDRYRGLLFPMSELDVRPVIECKGYNIRISGFASDRRHIDTVWGKNGELAVEIKKFTPRAVNRMSNRAVSVLDRLSVKPRIEADDPTFISYMAQPDRRQLEEYLATAEKCRSMKCMAELLQIKRRLFPDDDYFDSFRL